ncbi:hypothetical protein MASR2M29_03610 [Spirochaetota bacterium]
MSKTEDKLPYINYSRIIKDCFWDLDIDEAGIKEIVMGSEKRSKSLLFEKILLNSSSLFNDLEIFSREELAVLLEEYKVPKFNEKYAFRRKNMAEVWFFDKPLLIEELQWIV